MPKLCFAACVLLVASSACAQSPTSKPAAQSVASLPAGTNAVPPGGLSSYSSKTPAFTYTYPSEFQASGSGDEVLGKASKESSATAQKALSCMGMPLLAINSQAGRDGEAIMLLSIDLACLKAPIDPAVLGPVAQSSLSQGLQRIGTATVTAPLAYKLDGHDAVVLKGSVPGVDGGSAEYAAESCALIDHNAMCWMIMTNDKARLSTLLATTIHFEGHAPTPIVPPALAVTEISAK